VDPPVAGCERIKVGPEARSNGGSTDAWVDENGKVFVLVSREYLDHQVVLAAEVGGSVRAAIIAGDRFDIALTAELLQSINASRWSLSVYDVKRDAGDGFIAGTIETPAPTGLRHSKVSGSGSHVGSPGILFLENNANFQLLDFADPSTKLLDITTPAQNNGIPNSFAMWHGPSLYWFGNAGRRAIQRRWDADTGMVDFINYNDPDHGAGDMGTDGKDMVWIESHGPATKNALWTTADYWTSPYVKDKKDLKPRRLRSEVANVLFGVHVKVGCGRAALDTGVGMRVVEIATGNSWFFPNANKTGWGWVTPLVVTCDYIYARVGYSGPYVTVGRMPISSLGPPTPPD
jgi:hypothetical protein